MILTRAEFYALQARRRRRFHIFCAVAAVLLILLWLPACRTSLISVEAPRPGPATNFTTAPVHVPPGGKAQVPAAPAAAAVPGISDAQLEDWLNRVLGRNPN